MKLKQKRTKLIDKLLYILKPFLIYLIGKTFAMLLLSETCSLLFANETRVKLASPVNALASLIGVAFVMKDFLIEVAITGEIDIDAPGFVRFFKWIINGIAENKKKAFAILVSMLLAVSSSITFNALVGMLSVASSKYDNVETIQYSVPLWLGLILYGLISPWVEEIVFRGLLYNRMKRFFGVIPCVIVTSLMFGGFHANLPQFIYGTCMGIIIALVYEWTGTFETPILFHMTANIFTFVYTSLASDSNLFINIKSLIAFLIISLILLFTVHALKK